MVLKNNLDISVQRINPEIEETKIERENGAFDPSVEASLSRTDSTTPLNSRSSVAAGGRDSVESESNSLSVDLSGRLWTGTEYSAGFDDTWTENTFNQFRPEHDAFAGLKITQPLMKGAGREVNRYNILIAAKDLDISLNELRRRIIDTLANFKKAYWDLYQAIEELQVQKESFKLAESLLDINLKKYRAGVLSHLEVTQAEAGLAARKESVILAQQVVREKENSLKQLISGDLRALLGVKIILSDQPVVLPIEYDLENSINEAFSNRADYEALKLNLEKSGITVRYMKNQTMPQIDLDASYGFNGLGSSLGDSLSGMDANPQWTVGLLLKVPIGNRMAKNNLKIAGLEAKQAILDLKKLEQDILVQVDNAARALETNRERIEATKASTRLAQEALAAEERKFEAGLSTSHNVLQFQEELAGARSREIIAVIDYNKSIVEFSRVRGVLLKEDGIDFDTPEAGIDAPF